MSYWRLFLTSFRAGLSAFSNTWQGATLPLIESGYDTYQARMLRYWFNEAYHQNIIYDAINTYAEQIKTDKKLYHAIRGIYNPVARQTGIYKAKVYPGALDLEHLNTGAIPIIADNPIKEAAKQLFIWSNWGSEKNLYVGNGAKFADSFIKVLDDRDRGKVRFEVVDPRFVKYKRTDEVGNIEEIHFEYERVNHEKINKGVGRDISNDNQTFTYTEVITKDAIQVYRDGELWEGYHEFAPSGEWENPYGFVPVTHAKQTDEGREYGVTAYNPFTPKIDEINDAASVLNDFIRKNNNPPWYFAGVGGPESLNATATDSDGNQSKDALPAIYGPADSQPYPMVANVDISAGGQNIQYMLGELEADMPELALHQMRKQLGSGVSGITIGNLYDDAASRITEAQSNYDAPQIRAIQMGITIGAINGYDKFKAFNKDSYDAGKLELMIGARPPLRDTLSKRERFDLLLQTGAPPQGIWQEMGIGDETIKNWTGWLQDPEAMIADQIEAM